MIAPFRSARRQATLSHPRARWRARRRALAAARMTKRTLASAAFSACSASRVEVHTESMGHLPRTDSPDLLPVLPIAIARPHEAADYRSALLGSLDRWAHQSWKFVAPRLIPAALAFVGMLGVLAAMDAMASRCRLEPRAASTTVYLVGEDSARL
jgi:hypothetical protein